jgi:hypothetical protein
MAKSQLYALDPRDSDGLRILIWVCQTTSGPDGGRVVLGLTVLGTLATVRLIDALRWQQGPPDQNTNKVGLTNNREVVASRQASVNGVRTPDESVK